MSETARHLDLRSDHWAIVHSVLRQHVPDREVLAFGSRAIWTAKNYSDLDLAILGDNPLPLDVSAALAEAFSESDLPFKVDLVDWTRINDTFREIIRRDGVAVQISAGESDATGSKLESPPTCGKSATESHIDAGTMTRGWLFHPVFLPNWRRRSLHSLATWVNGIAFRDIQFAETGRPIVKIAEIKGRISGQTKFTQQTFDESVLVRPGDLLFSWSGQPETSIDAFWWRGPEGWLNQHIFRVTPKSDLDITFFYYLLRYLKPNFVGIAKNKQTTGLGHVTKLDLENLEVAYPDSMEQRAIARILGTLDDKIELNRQMNETLEAMARAIFRDWFVDFGPTRAKAEGRAPYLASELWDLFPDALDEEDKPVGWESKPLDEVAEFLNGLALQKFPASDAEGSLPVIKIAELRSGITAKSSRASREVPEKYVVKDGDFLFSWSGTLLAKFWTEGEGALNQHLFKVTSDRYPVWFFSQWVDHHLKEFQAIAASKATTMGHIQRKHLKEAMTICPPDDELIVLGQTVGQLVEHTIMNDLENRTLAQTRDLLLPKLMSGEIRLTGAEKALEAVT